jgi:hypothetical protein
MHGIKEAYNLRNLIIAIILVSTQVATALIMDVSAQAVKPAIFPPESTPYNITYPEGSVRWWKWALSIPEENNPITDQTGKNCGINQQGPVWFLTGTAGGSVVRDCTIPSGKAILVSPLNAECSFAEFPTMRTESELLACAKYPNDVQIYVSIDGTKVQDLDLYHVPSQLFNVTLPQNNIFGAPGGPTQAVSDGWWIMLKPLSTGTHTVHLSGIVLDNPVTGTQSFAVEVTYNLKVL